MNEQKVLDAFMLVAGKCPRLRHGKYIPLTYWVIKVNKKLEEAIQPRKLLRSLEKLNAINVEFSTETVQQTGVLKVVATERRVVRMQGSKPVRVGFLCVVTPMKPEENLPLNQTELGKFFQLRYGQYQNRKSIAPVGAPRLTMPGASFLSIPPLAPTNDVTTSLSSSSSVSPPRAVTPTEDINHEFYQLENKDLLDLLQSVIKPECLSNALLDGAKPDDFRQKIEAVGCKIRAKKKTKNTTTSWQKMKQKKERDPSKRTRRQIASSICRLFQISLSFCQTYRHYWIWQSVEKRVDNNK